MLGSCKRDNESYVCKKDGQFLYYLRASFSRRTLMHGLFIYLIMSTNTLICFIILVDRTLNRWSLSSKGICNVARKIVSIVWHSSDRNLTL